MELKKGTINIHYTIWCGGCGNPEDLKCTKNPEYAAAKKGWILTKEQGYVCPSCIARKKRLQV